MLTRSKHRMLAPLLTYAAFYLLMGCSSSSTSFYDNFQNQKNSEHQGTFQKVSIYMEHNASDNDTEIVISAKGNDIGLKNVWLRNPDGKEVLNISAENQDLGLREIDLETPEPENAKRITEQYPEGLYTFIGQTVDNKWLVSTATLSHSLPSQMALSVNAKPSSSNPSTAPLPNQEIIVSWALKPRITAYYLEVENKSKSNRIHLTLPASTSSISIPRYWFTGNETYSFNIQARNQDGNVTTSEVSRDIAIF